MYKSLVFGDEFLAQGLHLQSHQRCSTGIRTWFYADMGGTREGLAGAPAPPRKTKAPP